MSSPKASTEPQEASTAVPTFPAGATRVVQIFGVHKRYGMNWRLCYDLQDRLFQQEKDRGHEVEAVWDTSTPNGVSIYFIYISMCYSVLIHHTCRVTDQIS